MSNTINITGSTIGAMAVGEGATASSGGGEPACEPPRETFTFDFKATGFSRARIAQILRSTAIILDSPEIYKGTSFAETKNGTSRAWALTREPAK